jgi:hypothetical protein
VFKVRENLYLFNSIINQSKKAMIMDFYFLLPLLNFSQTAGMYNKINQSFEAKPFGEKENVKS